VGILSAKSKKLIMTKPLSFLFFCLFYFTFSYSSAAPHLIEQATPGGIIMISIAEIDQEAPKAFFNNKRVAMTKSNTHWLALIGIPLSAKLGEHKITLEMKGTDKNLTFKVFDKIYPAQYLTIKKKRMVTGFTKADLKKINSDKKEMTAAKSTWTEQTIDTHFIPPVDGRLSSLFGLKRFFNNIAKRPHNGLDIAAKTGTPIIAPASAKVINTGNFYFNGNTVFLDHGQGLLSAYLHMDTITVKEGQKVKQGDMLGTVGETGRVTGPHLHWIVYLNKTPIDPALFIPNDIERLNAKNKR